MAKKTPNYEEQRLARIESESPYARAAAEWVAAYNRSPESGIYQPNRLCDASRITDVNFTIVGRYFYSEGTYDYGGAGISYTFWPVSEVPRQAKPVNGMEIRWYEDMNAGKFIEGCVALLNREEI